MSANSKNAEFKEYASYWSIVWEQFKKNRTGYSALWAIFILFAIAVYAPVFIMKIPFIWTDESGTSFPWFRGLLFNRNIFASGVDLFFNLLLVLSPVLFGVLVWLKKKASKLDAQKAGALRKKVFRIVGLTLFVLFVAVLVSEPRTAILDYRRLALDDLGSGFFPPLRIAYEDTLHAIEGPGIFHVLGIDSAGRDNFVRLVYGTRVSLSVGVIAVSIYITIGVVMGSLAGYFGGMVDIVIQRIIEIFLCFPGFFLILTVIGFLEQPSLVWIMVIIGFIGWTSPARLVRGEFLRLKNIDFVAAAQACGLSNKRIIFRHILPNALGPVLVNATFGIASAILLESSLSFLGFGDPTLPSWGRLLSFGRATQNTSMMLIAGCAIFITVSVFNLAGEGIRDALDPKLRK
ncbi:MAG: ABC-type dipeptide/oligopeptide/nickel transport system permease subunit [Bradymonadia bacterium]|jgi:ABC-type dipeptide/oligopeptide/nickel transport system permease subunit